MEFASRLMQSVLGLTVGLWPIARQQGVASRSLLGLFYLIDELEDSTGMGLIMVVLAPAPAPALEAVRMVELAQVCFIPHP